MSPVLQVEKPETPSGHPQSQRVLIPDPTQTACSPRAVPGGDLPSRQVKRLYQAQGSAVAATLGSFPSQKHSQG